MEDDNDIDLDDLDEDVLLQLDNLESTLIGKGAAPANAAPPAARSASDIKRPREAEPGPGKKDDAQLPPSSKKAVMEAVELSDTDDLGDEAGWDDSAFLAHLDEAETEARAGGTAQQQQQQQADIPRPRPAQGSSSATKSRTGGVQRTLFGDIAPSPGVFRQAAAHANTAVAGSSQGYAAASSPPSRLGGNSSLPNTSAATARRSTKQWDRTLYAASGRMKKKRPVRGSWMDANDDQGDEDIFDDDDGQDPEEEVFEAFPPAEEELPPAPKAMKLQVDREATRTWVYPTNKEHRDYQFNIVQRALFNNVLVALPTGLGKTFIAAVVILNYYRWYPKGKIIFVAPTKPLVAQQQQACHGICGLPWDQAVELTGDTKASLRGDEWKTKRIFYMTPQTFENDLCSSAIDTSDVICVVVDEAHRATGNYAYANVIRYLTARNPFFRILALTATPGSNTEKVQEVVDNLHINSIEIRSEKALDIRSYVHTKSEDPVVVPLGSVVSTLKEGMCTLMRGPLERLNKAGVVHQTDPASLHPFTITSANADPRKRAVIYQQKLFHAMKEMRQMAEALRYLTEHSVRMFSSRMLELETGVNSRGTKASNKQTQAKMRSNTIIKNMTKVFEEAQDNSGRVSHPKMDYLKDVLLAHFSDLKEKSQETRAMVFCQYRECVNEIVEMLNEDRGEIRATIFVGQAPDRNGGRGFTQKDQERVIKEFRKGQFNVLVATSIGEEGLDIGEVDLIVCYEAVKDSVRMLQRVGRTGRKRDGRIVVLMSEGVEERNWQKSKDSYKSIQNEITSGASFELYDDVPRLVPDDIVSEVEFKEVDQPTFEPDLIRKNRAGAKKAAKPKRNSDPFRNIPKGALDGFVKVSDLRKGKGKGKKGRASNGDREADDESSEEEKPSTGDAEPPSKIDGMSDDSDDEALARGLDFDELRRSDGGSKGKERARDVSSSSSSPAMSNQGNATASEQRRGRRLGVGRYHGSTALSPAPVRGQPAATLVLDSSPAVAVESTFDGENYNTFDASIAKGQRPRLEQRREPLRAIGQPQGTLDDELDDSLEWADLSRVTQDASRTAAEQQRQPEALERETSLSPVLLKKRNRPHPLLARLTGGGRVSSGEEDENNRKGDDDDDGDDEDDEEGSRIGEMLRKDVVDPDEAPQDTSILSSQESFVERMAKGKQKRTRTYVVASSSPTGQCAGESSTMGPPLQPASVLRNGGHKNKGKKRRESSEEEEEMVMSSQDASPSRKRTARRKPDSSRTLNVSDKDGVEAKRGRTMGKASTAKVKAREQNGAKEKKKKKRVGCSPTSRFLFQHEAERDTDEEQHGQRDEDDEGLGSDMADSSDLEHVGDFEPTQAPKGYHQSAVYFQSLNSQTAPSPFRKSAGARYIPGFEVRARVDSAAVMGGRGSATAGRGARASVGLSRPSVAASSSGGPRGSQTDDEYERGSFVCSDEDVEFETDAEEDGEDI